MIKATKKKVQKDKVFIMFDKPLSSKDTHASVSDRTLSHTRGCCDAKIVHSAHVHEIIGLIAKEECAKDILKFQDIQYA